jgi:dimethylamine monooxygenase subunit A
VSWLVRDELFDLEIDLKIRLLHERYDDVFASLPSADMASKEAHKLISDWVRERFPENSTDASLPPLVRAALLIQEDVAILVRHSDGWRLDAGVVCFPAVWRLADKVGLSMADVHSPVPHYNTELRARVDRFLDRLEPEKSVHRRNLSLKPTHALFLPTPKSVAHRGAISVNPNGEPYWLRSERQTFRRLPGSGSILFTIRTQLAPARLLLDRPDIANRILETYRSWDESMSDFKMADSDLNASFLPWLERVCKGSSNSLESRNGFEHR